MKTNLFWMLLIAGTLFGQSSSTHHEFHHAPLGTGGGTIANGSETVVAETSLGDAFGGGVSDLTASGVQLKHNYTGQLYDVVSIEVAATPTTIAEGGTRQLTTTVTLDDTTRLALTPDEFVWGFGAGIAGIDPLTGLATAELVYEDRLAPVSAGHAGVNSADLILTILNLDPDNYLDYAGDGLDDDWQVSYFGPPPNAGAAPGSDFDLDGDDNEKEFLFGFSPIDPHDFFRLAITVAADPSKVDLRLNRVIPDRTYTVLTGTDLLTYPTTAVPGFSVSSAETDKLFSDVPAPSGASFIVVEATRSETPGP